MKKLLSLILILAMALSMVTVSYAADLSANLVAYWDFDEIVDGKIPDVTGNGNDLTIQDTEYDVITGFTGNTIDFHNVDQLGAASFGPYNGAKHATADAEVLKNMTDSLNGADGLTVSMWIKREKHGSSAKNAVVCIAPKNAVLKLSAERFGFLMESRSNISETSALTNRFYPIASSTDFYPVIGSVDGPNRHAWVHVTAVNDYANKKQLVYLDGELVDEIDASSWTDVVSSFTADETTGYIGVGESNSILDDVKVYNKALTQDEIKEEIPPVLQYEYEEISNGTVLNAKGVNAPITLPAGAEVVEGVVGNTIHFGGKGTLPHMTYKVNLLQSKAISFSTWVKSVDGVVTTKASGQSILSEGIGGFNIVLNSNGTVRVGGRAQHSDGLASVTSTAPVFTAGDTSWHHIAGTINYVDKTVTLYVDGSLNGTQDFTGPDSSGKAYFSQPWYFVKAHTASHIDSFDLKNTADVLLDDTKIYRRALTANEVTEMASVLPFAEPAFTTTSTAVIANCNIANMSGAEIAENEVMLILAAYDVETGLLEYAEKAYIPALAIGGRAANVNVAITGIDEPANYTYKLFAWGDLGELISYQDEIVYEAE